ncbi:MAG: TonB-dependent receptor plug domain-containing protein [Puniceicoccaceae bacterium]
MFINPKTLKHFTASAVFAVLSPVMAFAQDTGADEEEVYILSPFEITAADEDGYLATSSLAGTRISADLSDIGSAISVYTEEFLEDVGATDNETLLSYSLNTEVGGFRGNFINATSEGIENQNLESPNNNTRIRGLTAADNTLNYYLTDIPWDSYIVRRVDIQRGANSVLFGLGSPAGIINATTVGAEFDTFGKIVARVDEHGSGRLNLDYNREVIENTLAVRIALLKDDRKFQQDPAFEDTKRGFASFTWAPEALNSSSTSFRVKASFESGESTSNRPRMVAPIDRLSMWLAPTSSSGFGGEWANLKDYGYNQTAYNQYDDYLAGAGEVNFRPWNAMFSDGITPLVLWEGDTFTHITEVSSNDRGSWFYNTTMADAGATEAVPNDGSADFSNGTSVQRNLKHPAQTTLNGIAQAASGLNLPYAGFWKDSSLTSTHHFDFFNKLIDGDSKRELKDWDYWELDITQTFLNNKLGYSLGAFQQDYQTEFYAALGNVFAPGITVDIGEWDRTSQPGARVRNPNLGRVLVRDANSGGRMSNSSRESVRLQAFLRHDFTENSESLLSRILGKHDLVAVGQNRKLDRKSSSFELLGMSREYLLNRAESVRPLADLPPPGSRLAEYNRTLGSTSPDHVFYLSANPDYSSIGNIGTHLKDLPHGTHAIAGFDATPLPGFTAAMAAMPWADSPFGSHETERFQAENPEYYRGWQNSIGDYYIANAYQSDADREYLTTVKNFFTEDLDSIAAVWTGRWFNGGLVGMYGWRQDDVTETWYEHDFRLDGPHVDVAGNRSERSTTVESNNWSLKANLTYLAGMSGRLPFDVHVLYSEGEVQTPDPTRVDVFGRTLPNSTGNTEDLSLMITSADNKWSFRATRYETIVKNGISGASVNSQKYRVQQVLQQGAFRAGLIETGQQSYTADWLELSPSAEAAGFTTEADYRVQVMAPAWREFERGLWEQFPLTRSWYRSEFQPGDQVAPQILFPDNATLVEDSISKGWEFEFVGNITKNWNLAVNASKTEAIRDNLPGDEFGAVVDYIVEAMQGPAGEVPIWWFTGPGMGSHLAPFLGELTKAKALNGSAQPEIRKWKGNVITNYNFRNGRFDGFGIGGAYRYEDSQIYSYGLSLDAEGNTKVHLDQTFEDDARHTFDFWVTYNRPLTDKVDWRIQLNIYNAFGSNELVPLHRNPDGSIGLQGIKEGMSWAVTNTFSF